MFLNTPYYVPDELADDDARLPGDGDLPDDVGEDRDQAHAQVGRSKVLDEKVHPRFPPLERSDCVKC